MSQTHPMSEDVKTCLKVFPLLAILILITVAVHQSHLPYKVQLAIEITKAVIAIGYFLHLIANRSQISRVWLLTIVFVLALLLLPIGNAFNHLHGTVDTSKELQAEKLADQSAAAEGEGERVH